MHLPVYADLSKMCNIACGKENEEIKPNFASGRSGKRVWRGQNIIQLGVLGAEITVLGLSHKKIIQEQNVKFQRFRKLRVVQRYRISKKINSFKYKTKAR